MSSAASNQKPFSGNNDVSVGSVDDPTDQLPEYATPHQSTDTAEGDQIFVSGQTPTTFSNGKAKVHT